MDSLSTSVSSLKVPTLNSTLLTSREHHHFTTRNPSSHHQQLLPYYLTTKLNSVPNKKTTFSRPFSLKQLKNSPISSPTSLTSSFKSSTQNSHKNPATGYAAALLDIAQCDNSLARVERDAQRLWRVLNNEEIGALLSDPSVGEKDKGQIVKEVAKKGKFDRLVVGLVKMLVDRKNVAFVSEVLVEFERIVDQLSGTRVVLVSSREKMKEDELLGIAERVQKISGAVKVKVRNLLVDEKCPLLAL